MPKQSDQLKRIDALFSGISSNNQRRNSDITIVENQTSSKCTVHSKKRRDSIESNKTNNNLTSLSARRNSNLQLSSSPSSVHHNVNINSSNINIKDSDNYSSLIKNNNNYLNNNYSDVKKRNNSITSSSSLNKSDHLRRRQSFTEGFGHSTYDRNRKRNSWNVNMFKTIEHPSAFPSLLRSETPIHSDTNYRNNISNSTSSGINYNGMGETSLYTTLPRKSTNLSRRSSMSVLSVNNNKYKPLSTSISGFGSTNMTRNKQFGGSSLYLRPDSSGNTNLVRRDSIGTRSVANFGADLFPSTPATLRNKGSTTTAAARDYVSDRANSALSPTPPPLSTSSILRRSSVDYDKNYKSDKLTKENLTRHVRILENEDPFISPSLVTTSPSYLNKWRRQSNSSNDDLSSLKSRRMSMDSLDWRRSSIELDENDFSHLTIKSSKEKVGHNHEHDHDRPQFVAVTSLEDTQAVRCAEFHPSGKLYAVGSNSKTFRLCEYPSLSEIREGHVTYEPAVLFKRTKHHKGSIYCIGWSPDGELIATGSNDKTIKIMRYDDNRKQLEGREIELTMHDGTVRDLCFLEDSSNKASLLISGGAGDCKIYVTDCATATPFQALSGHGGTILSLYNWGGAMFVSGSQDKTVRFWDLRTRGCVNTITPATNPGSRIGSPAAAVCVDPSGRLLVSGHEDSSCVLYDIRGNRPIQCFKPHTSDLRSIRFSPSAYYLLTAGYDHKLALTDLQGDLTLPLPSVVVAHHTDKVISGRWHPKDFSFVSTSADKTVTLWALPPA